MSKREHIGKTSADSEQSVTAESAKTEQGVNDSFTPSPESTPHQPQGETTREQLDDKIRRAIETVHNQACSRNDSQSGYVTLSSYDVSLIADDTIPALISLFNQELVKELEVIPYESLSVTSDYLIDRIAVLAKPPLDICELCGQEMNANCNNANCDGKGIGE